MFCNNIDDIINRLPLFAPSVAIMLDTLYPRQKPLKHIIPYTTKIPITVSPANHNNNARNRFFFIELKNNFI